jgi:serine/threonine protein kinase
LKNFFFDNDKYNSLLEDEVIVYLISIQILRALNYIHSLNISHRDIKFENIMINTSTYEIKLIDFNVSKLIKGNENRATIIDNGICSSKSLVPLLIENSNENDKIDIDSTDYFFYSDIYSFGVLLYLLSTRKITEKFNPIFSLYQNIKYHYLILVF